MPVPIACVGLPSSVSGDPLPPGVIAKGAATVRVGPNRLPVATVGSLIAPHGNSGDNKGKGYNPECMKAVITKGIPNIMVEGRMVAMLGAPCSCKQHFVTKGVPNVYVGK